MGLRRLGTESSPDLTSVARARTDGGSASAPSSATARRASASPTAEVSVSRRPRV
jgi:hypothetical protein